MTQYTCPQCSAAIEYATAKCPACGYSDRRMRGRAQAAALSVTASPEQQERTAKIFKIAVGVLVTLAVVALVNYTTRPLTPEEWRERERRAASKRQAQAASTLEVACETHSKRRLRAPATARYDRSMWRVSFPSPAHAIVYGEVDAQNGFGALLRNTVLCFYRATSDDWLLDSVSIAAR